jgi:hypothetical protein
MEIQLSNEYRIVSDEFQFVVQSMKLIQASKMTKEENIGKEKWSDIGYFPKINQALKCVSNNILLANKDLDVIITKLNNLDIKIDEIKELLESTRIKGLLETKNIRMEMQIDKEFDEEMGEV